MVVQHLYNDMSFHSPFLVVYIGTSLFSIFLPSRLMYERCSWCVGRRRELSSNDENTHYNNVEVVIIIPWRNYSDRGQGDEGIDMISPSTTLRDNRHYEGTSTEEDNYEPSSLSQSQSSPNNNNGTTMINTMILSHQDHISMASKVAPLWFISNYFYATSLEWTSIASSTVLASMGSIFAFAFATCSLFGDERVTKWKLLGVVLCFAGGVATAWTDKDADHVTGDLEDDVDHDNATSTQQQRSFLGDCAGLFSAIGYGAYTNLLRHLCPKDEDLMSMQLLFGYIGLLNMVILLPVAIWVIIAYDDDDIHESTESSQKGGYTDTTVHTTLTASIFLFLILKGLLDNVLSDYLWARAVILTSATVASVGVGLTIPMAFLADWIMDNHSVTSRGDVIGAVFVLFGFVFVNIDGEETMKVERRRLEEGGADLYEETDRANTVINATDDNNAELS
jgi:solute carrier family 35 protein F5